MQLVGEFQCYKVCDQSKSQSEPAYDNPIDASRILFSKYHLELALNEKPSLCRSFLGILITSPKKSGSDLPAYKLSAFSLCLLLRRRQRYMKLFTSTTAPSYHGSELQCRVRKDKISKALMVCYPERDMISSTEISRDRTHQLEHQHGQEARTPRWNPTLWPRPRKVLLMGTFLPLKRLACPLLLLLLHKKIISPQAPHQDRRKMCKRTIRRRLGTRIFRVKEAYVACENPSPPTAIVIRVLRTLSKKASHLQTT